MGDAEEDNKRARKVIEVDKFGVVNSQTQRYGHATEY
jgi:hypothetical protein